MLSYIAPVLSSYDHERDVCLWAMDILSKIQSILSNQPSTAKEPHFLFLLDVFYTIVIVRSGYAWLVHIQFERGLDQHLSICRKQQLDIFPEALCQLMKMDAWSDCEARVRMDLHIRYNCAD